MKDVLAEQLLARVMGWEPGDVARERPILQAMAQLKWDEYQQFSPGMRFVESLAVWLSQFESQAERDTAYRFVRERVIFVSASELAHLISIAFPDYLRPSLLEFASEASEIPRTQIARLVRSTEFRKIVRKTLFLGLSDGARTDVFRRANRALKHEQVWQTYEIPDERADDLVKDLRKDLRESGEEHAENARFQNVVLMDDLAASGTSYSRTEDGKRKGKIATFFRALEKPKGLSTMVDRTKLRVFVLLYVVTARAETYLSQQLRELEAETKVPVQLRAVQCIPESVCVRPNDSDPMSPLIERYYDPVAETEHTKKGGTERVDYGFAGCGLPLIMHHNTPNNSLYLLWAEQPSEVRPLFPRVSRFKADT